MEKLKNTSAKLLAKFITVLFIIVTMLFSNIVPIIVWAEEVLNENGTVIDSQYIKFDLKWSDDSNEITMENGSTIARFDLQFDTATNFKNFRIEVEKADLVDVHFSNSGEYFGDSSDVTQIQYLKDIPGGTKITGAINFNFKRPDDFSDYSRDLVIKLIGTYDLDGEEKTVEITKNLKANITSKTVSVTGNTDMELYATDKEITTLQNTSETYKVSKIKLTYVIKLTGLLIEHIKLDCNIYRTNANDEILKPTSVSISNAGFKVLEQENENGTISYILEKGEEHEDIDPSNLFNYTTGHEAFIRFNVVYNIDNAEKEGATQLKADVRLTTTNYSYIQDAQGKHYSKTTINKNDANSISETLYRHTTGKATWGNVNLYTEKYDHAYNQKSLQDFIKNGEMEVPFGTNFTYVSGVDSTGNVKITNNVRKYKIF